MELFQNELDKASLFMDKNTDEALTDLFKQTKLTISVAETITEGLLSQRLSQLPHSPSFFLGGIISNHPMTTIKLCQISPTKLRASADGTIALEMAKNTNKLIQSDITLATAHVSRKEATTTKKNIFIGLFFGKIEKVTGFHFMGSKNAVRTKTAQTALLFLKQNLENWINKSSQYQEENE